MKGLNHCSHPMLDKLIMLSIILVSYFLILLKYDEFYNFEGQYHEKR